MAHGIGAVAGGVKVVRQEVKALSAEEQAVAAEARAARAEAKAAKKLVAHEPRAPENGYPRDFPTKETRNWSAAMSSEGEARALAREKLGEHPVEVEPGKLRSRDGRWQYRAKPGDIEDGHIHLEELDPQTGQVKQNLHLRWPRGEGR